MNHDDPIRGPLITPDLIAAFARFVDTADPEEVIAWIVRYGIDEDAARSWYRETRMKRYALTGAIFGYGVYNPNDGRPLPPEPIWFPNEPNGGAR